jgi:parvulin-like peptidyl-prolyl isomerase
MRRYSKRNKNSIKLLLVVVVAFAIIAALYIKFSQRIEQTTVAKINDVEIYKSEVERKISDIFNQNITGQKIIEIEKLPKEALEILVKEIYLEKKLNELAKKSDVAKQQFVKDKIEDAKNRILRQYYLESELTTEVSEEKIAAKYAELNNEVTGKKEYSISHILVKNKEEAEKISKELSKKSSQFSELAKKKSVDQESAGNGGNLGYVLEDNIMKELLQVVQNLKKDEISKPVQTKFGWHIVKFTDVRDAKTIPFESVKEAIKEQLKQEKINQINSDIIKNADIKILIDLQSAEQKDSSEKSSQNSTEEVKNLEPEENKTNDQQQTEQQNSESSEVENSEVNSPKEIVSEEDQPKKEIKESKAEKKKLKSQSKSNGKTQKKQKQNSQKQN